MPIDQPPSAPPVGVAPVVVATAQLPSAPGDAAFSIVTVNAGVLKLAERTDEALASVPGFSLFRRTSSLGANPTTQGVSLRSIAGSGASRALVTLDGVPQNDPFGGWVIWTGLPPQAVAGASIVRGAGAGPYGAGALTGVVALQSPMNAAGGFAGEVEGGGLGYVRAAGVGAAELGGARLFVDASGERSDGWIPVIQGRGSVDRPLTLRDWSAAERLEADVGDAVLAERVGVYEEDRGAGTLYAGSHDQGIQGSLSLARQPDAGALGWRVQGWVTATNLANTSATVAANRDSASLSDAQYATPAVGAGLSAAVRQMWAQGSWELGVDVRDDDGESRDRLYTAGVATGVRTGGGGQAIAGAYAEASRDIGPWLITGGVRLDVWEDFDSSLVQTGSTVLDQHPANRSGVVPTGRIGLRRDLTQSLYLRAAAYAGFRAPTLNELHRPFRVGNDVTEANADLSPERLVGGEAGVGGQGRVKWDADVFYNRLEDAVTNVTLGKGPGSFPIAGFVPAGGTLFERENAGSVNAWGAEADADWPAGPGFDLRLAASYTHARVDGGDQAPQLTGLRPAETPTAVVTAGADWRPLARLTLSADLRYQSASFDDDANTRKIDGGAGLDVRAGWQVNAQVTAFAAVDNVTDAELQNGRSAAGVVTYAAPRLWRLGLALRR
jgi:outer membrane receptor protein involved in Fe transport